VSRSRRTRSSSRSIRLRAPHSSTQPRGGDTPVGRTCCSTCSAGARSLTRPQSRPRCRADCPQVARERDKVRSSVARACDPEWTVPRLVPGAGSNSVGHLRVTDVESSDDCERVSECLGAPTASTDNTRSPYRQMMPVGSCSYDDHIFTCFLLNCLVGPSLSISDSRTMRRRRTPSTRACNCP